jgi:hypothetical protein
MRFQGLEAFNLVRFYTQQAFGDNIKALIDGYKGAVVYDKVIAHSFIP